MRSSSKTISRKAFDAGGAGSSGRPAEKLYIARKTGSSREAHIDRAMLAIQSYAPSMYEAARLNERVKAAMDSAAELDAVSASRLNSDYNFTDTTTKRYRYQAVYDLVYYDE